MSRGATVAALGLALGLLGLGVGCSKESLSWSVDVRTDLAPGSDFTRVQVDLWAASVAARGLADEPKDRVVVAATWGADYLGGMRVAEFDVLPGDYVLRTSLVTDEGSVVVSRDVLLRLTMNTTTMVLLTSSCTGVVCPDAGGDPTLTTCLGGQCVAPECSSGSPEACGPAECTSSDECGAVVACAEGRCADGYCVQVQRAEGCASGQRCDLDSGCVEAPPTTEDASVPDAFIPPPPTDAGPTCDPTGETCNGVDDDCDGRVDEDFDLTTTAMCGACGATCTVGWSCSAGSCARPPGPPAGPADQYLVGDWDGDGDDNLAVRFGGCVWMDVDEDPHHDIRQCFGNAGDTYLVGDWNGDGRDNLGVLRGDCVLIDHDFDAVADGAAYCFGDSGDSYFAGDWDGDGDDDLAVERAACLLMDTNGGGVAEGTHCLGDPGERYVIGDWNGDGDHDAAALRGGCVLIDEDRNGVPERSPCFGNPGDVMLVGDWDGDGDDDLAVVQPSRCVQLDLDDRGGAAEGTRCYGDGL